MKEDLSFWECLHFIFFFWQIFALDREFLVDSLSSFNTLETLYHLLDLFSDENSALMYVTFALHEICLCLVCFPIFLFIFLLSSWVMMFLGVVFLVFILLGFHQCPWVSTLGFPNSLGKHSTVSSLHFFLCPFLSVYSIWKSNCTRCIA